MRRWMLWAIVVLGVIFIGAMAAGRIFASENSAAQVEQKSIPVSGEIPPVDRMQQQLLNPRLDTSSRESLMEKIELAKQAQEDRQAGEVSPAPKMAPEFSSDSQKAALQVETGIFPGSEGMIRPSAANINNYWQGVVDGKIHQIFAGSTASDSAQGLVIVVSSSTDPNISDVSFEFVNAPAESGALTVISESEGVLTLQTPHETLLTFSIASKSFSP